MVVDSTSPTFLVTFIDWQSCTVGIRNVMKLAEYTSVNSIPDVTNSVHTKTHNKFIQNNLRLFISYLTIILRNSDNRMDRVHLLTFSIRILRSYYFDRNVEIPFSKSPRFTTKLQLLLIN